MPQVQKIKQCNSSESIIQGLHPGEFRRSPFEASNKSSTKVENRKNRCNK